MQLAPKETAMHRNQRNWPTMHPSIQREVAEVQIADLHRQAEHDRTARAIRLARKTDARHFVSGQLATVLARRVLAVLAATARGQARHHLTVLSRTDRTTPDQGGRSGHPVDPDLQIRIPAH
jgi:hypothetical protein